MTSLRDIRELRRRLADTNVLSVYIAAEEHDPTQRFNWRTRLQQQLDRLEGTIDVNTKVELASSRRLLEQQLEQYPEFLPGRGWVAFITADAGVHCTTLPAPMPDLVRWHKGPLLGPCLRALKQDRTVLVALVDSRRARLIRYHGGVMTEAVDYRADDFIDDLTDRNMSKRASTHSGIRGETATDTAQRILRLQRHELVLDLAERVRATGSEALLIIGGPTEVAAALHRALQPALHERLIVEPSLHLLMSLPEVQVIIEPAASRLTQQLQHSLAQDALDRTRAHERGAVGAAAVSACATAGQLDLLLLTPRFLAEWEKDAERIIADALDAGSNIQLVSGDAATLIDSHAQGVAARLRFVTAQPLEASADGAPH